MAANLASQRPPWEASQIPREEFSTILSNRSAAFYEMGDYISALVDAETVIQIRKPWSKGYFRKAKALMKLQSYQEAKETLEIGLSFEPDNQVRPSLRIIRSESHWHYRKWLVCSKPLRATSTPRKRRNSLPHDYLLYSLDRSS